MQRLLCAVALLAAPVASAWDVHIGSSAPYTIAIDAGGNIFAAISRPAGRHSATTAVVKLSARTGREKWRRSLKVPGREHSDEVAGFAVLEGGDVVVAGGVEIGGHVRFVAIRLSGGTGRPQWYRMIQGDPRTGTYDHAAHAVATDAAGNVLVAGDLESATYVQYHSTHDLAVVKLARDTGEELWRFVLDGTAHEFDSASAVAVDASGDVLVAGTVSDVANTDIGYRSATTLLKLSGSNGRLVWRHEVSELADVRAMTLDAHGAVLAAGTFAVPGGGNDFGVVEVDGQNGTARWAASIGRSDKTWEAAFGVAPLPSGDVAAVGFTGDLDARASFTVAAFDGTTGAERWHRFVEGTDGYGVGAKIGVTAQGNVVAGGRLRNTGSCYDVTVMELDGATGATVSEHLLDGSATATRCDQPKDVEPCRFRCPFTRVGIDQDTLTALAIDPLGRVVFTGWLNDGRRGRSHAFVEQLPGAGPPE